MGGVFQLETVDEALLVICYPGIWIDPKFPPGLPRPFPTHFWGGVFTTSAAGRLYSEGSYLQREAP